MFTDILLPISSFPEPLPSTGLQSAVELSAILKGRVTALAVDIDFNVPSNVLANALLDLPGMVSAARSRAAANAGASLASVAAARSTFKVEGEDLSLSCLEAEIPDLVTRHARLRDLTIVVAPEAGAMQQWLAESVIFGSGHPVVVMPGSGRSFEPGRGLTVGIAWDGTRPAARAIADAMPILEAAESVSVVTVRDEKALTRGSVFDDLKRHLLTHGISAECSEIGAAGRPIGDVLSAFAREHALDLLVMGAYAHSRFRDFVLGGATRSVVAAPTIPVFLSH